jgi:rfaE bifunctional protein nucleotidyltransferase chain/domain
MRNPDDKIMTLDQAVHWQQRLAADGLQVGVTNGCFDLLHRGHVEYLNRARAAVDALMVLVNSDASIRQVKGPGRPVVSEDDRVYLLASLESVDAVVVFETVDCLPLFEQLRPSVYIKGGDYTEETLVREEYLLLKSLGAKFLFIPFVKGLSTTEMIRRIRRENEEAE